MEPNERLKQILEILNGTDPSVDSPLEVLYAVVTDDLSHTSDEGTMCEVKDRIRSVYFLVQRIRDWNHEALGESPT